MVKDSEIGYFAFSPFIFLIFFLIDFIPDLKMEIFGEENEVVLMNSSYVIFLSFIVRK